MTTRPAYAHVGRANGGDDAAQRAPLPPAMLAALETRLEAGGLGRFDRPDILDAVAGVLGPDVARWQRIEAAAREWRAARDAAISGGNWLPGAPVRRYEDAIEVLAAVLSATCDAAGGDDRAARIEAAARAVLASGQARYRYRSFGDVLTNEFESAVEPGDGDDAEHVGDLVPAAEMAALRAAVEGVPGAEAPAWKIEAPTEPGRYWGVWRGAGNRPQVTRVVPCYGVRHLEIEWAGERWPLAEVVLWGPVIAPAAPPPGWREALYEETEADRQAMRRALDAAVIQREEATDGD